VSRLAGRHLYLCTPTRADLESFVEACIVGGVDVVQLREKNLEARQVLEAGRRLKTVCRAHGVPFLMNDRPDLAAEVEADGVHLGQDDAPPALARRLLGPEAVVGLSTHAPGELDRALSEPVDYLSAGPVEETPTKPGRPGTGLAYAGWAAARSPWPVFVTGGVNPDRVPGLAAAGVRHFVVVRYLTESDDPTLAARRLRAAIDRSLEAAGAV
jgi:thiamine-phosphate pyrophosphorylase